MITDPDELPHSVRLHGPVRGRGAICRDLRVDLSRVKELGVGCIVWYVSYRFYH